MALPAPEPGPGWLRRAWRLTRFAVAVWAPWRRLQLGVVVAFGGDVLDATFYFDGGWFRTILSHGYAITDPSYETQQNPAFMPAVAWFAWH